MNLRAFLFGLAVSSLFVGCGKKADETAVAPKASTKEEAPAPSGPDVSKLANALKNTRSERLMAAIDIALQINHAGDDPIPTLLEALKDPNSAALGETSLEKPNSTREAAVMALLKLGPKGKAALLKDGIKPLKDGLKDAKPNVREHTVNAFAIIGTDAKPFADDIAALAGDREMAVRAAVYRTLDRAKVPAPANILKLLLDNDASIATDAAAALATNKPTGADAVPALIAALKRPGSETFPPNQLAYLKNHVAEALASLGKSAESAIPELIQLVKATTVEDVERMTRPRKPNEKQPPAPGPVQALRRFGVSAVPSVLPLLKDDKPIVRYQAALVFSGLPTSDLIKEHLPALQTALAAERTLPTGQMYVFEELIQAAIHLDGDAELITKQLVELLSSDNEAVRYRSVNLFRGLGSRGASAVPKLQELLNDPEALIKIAVLNVLAVIGPAAKGATAEVAKLAESTDENISRAAVQALQRIGSDSPLAVPALTKLLDSNNRNVVIESCQALAKLGANAAGATEKLTKLLDDVNTHLEEQTAILLALAAIGNAAKEAIPTVTKLATHTDYKVRAAAVTCLGKISVYDAAVGKVFADRLVDSFPTVRINTLKAISQYGTKATASAKDIQKMMDGTKSPDLKLWCASALVAVGVNADANVALIVEGLKPKATARLAAFDCLAQLGVKAKPGIPDLLEALKDKSPTLKGGVSIREKAITTCAALSTQTKAAIVPIADMLRDSDSGIRKAAAEALGAYGPEAIVTVPKLRTLAEASDPASEAANYAIEKIVPQKKKEESSE